MVILVWEDKGLWYIEMHLMSSAMLIRVPFWITDNKLNEVAIKLGVAVS